MSLYTVLKNYVEEKFSAPASHIYHYTKPEYGKKIIESGVLLLTPHDALNKKNNREFKVGPEIIKDKLKKTSIKHVFPLFDEKECYFKSYKSYIASFSKEDNYEYTKQKYGTFYVGFKDSYLEKFKNSESVLLLGHVIYSRKEQEKIISEMIELHEGYPNSYDRKLNDLVLWLYFVIPLLKEECDHRDNECRIIATHLLELDDPTKVVGKHCATEITFNKNDIILPSSF